MSLEVFSCCCPLCESDAFTPFFRDSRRDYLRCAQCALVYVPPPQYLSASEEKAEYDKHDNRIDDQGYRQFLSRLARPLLKQIKPASTILEFGCGPGPALADILHQAGHSVSLYDAFYYPDNVVLKRHYYDVITATEVIEHLHHPKREIAAWMSYLKPDGILGVMTKIVIDAERFAGWHYKNDLTHVAFYSAETFNYIGKTLNMQWRAVAQDAFIFERIS